MAVVLSKERGLKLGISRGLIWGIGRERLDEIEDKQDDLIHVFGK